MTALIGIGDLIAQTPGVSGGRPCVAGTGVSVAHIALLAAEGNTPEQIANEVHPGQLTIAQVYAALAYYHRNRAAIDADSAARLAEAERLEREHSRFTRH